MAAGKGVWADVAATKRGSILANIPVEWKVDVSSDPDPKDVTGPYIEQFLDAEEIEITNGDMVKILGCVATGVWAARNVTRAFCHRAALAHQLVRNKLALER